MAEIQQNTSSRKGAAKGRKHSTRVDLTPMVDLGFLLITFFIFTSSMATPRAMKLNLPFDNDITDSMETPATRTITFILTDNRLFYYEGLLDGVMHEATYPQMRTIIMEKKKQLLQSTARNKIFVVLKATAEANYKNIVDGLDEMIINSVDSYVLTEIELVENQLIAKIRHKD